MSNLYKAFFFLLAAGVVVALVMHGSVLSCFSAGVVLMVLIGAIRQEIELENERTARYRLE